ncbi:hypothetical protein LWI28_009398 [Acer negundo]|uniref:Uncharacterized protein n=1 Tax=Acer negundo TaxID=4023 RepID=A0AAD5J9N1_ACENE|nr:hypothetical protein LWI28_009398 [Acer negundo]
MRVLSRVGSRGFVLSIPQLFSRGDIPVASFSLVVPRKPSRHRRTNATFLVALCTKPALMAVRRKVGGLRPRPSPDRAAAGSSIGFFGRRRVQSVVEGLRRRALPLGDE